MRLVIVISGASLLDATYTTVHIATAALDRGHPVRFVEPWDFEVDPAGRLLARAHALDEPVASREALVQLLDRREASRRYVEFGPGDVVLLRINPFDPAVVSYAQMARRSGARVHNDPSTILLTGHKGYLATLSGVPRPKTLVTRSRSTATLFAADQATGVVVKPARASGGRGVSFLEDPHDQPRLERAFEDARQLGDGYVVIQEYLPGASAGEKRLVWLDGDVIGGYLRCRAPGDFRHNLVRGGSPMPCLIGREDHDLVKRITPHLLRDGVWLAGLDVIDGRIVEVNTLNPGGVHYGDALNGTCMAECIVRRLEEEQPARAAELAST